MGANLPVPGLFSNRRARIYVVFLVLVVSLFFLTIISIGTGAVSIPAGVVLKIIASQFTGGLGVDELVQSEAIVMSIRLPRILMAITVGATLAICGATLQGLFRNPLADPQLIGVSSGAALGAAFIIIFGSSLIEVLPIESSLSLIPFMSFFGGLIATIVVYKISSLNGKTSVSTMLLAGIAINALCAAAIGYLIFSADDNQIRDFTFWTLGSLNGSTWKSFYSVLPFLAFSIVVLPFLSNKINIILLGESEAKYLGINVERLKQYVILLTALGVGAAVAVSGIIGFVGLVVPHLLRLIIGPDLRTLMPASILFGALLLLGSDLVARTVVAPTELPIGIVTSTIGAPFFIWLLIRNRNLRNYL